MTHNKRFRDDDFVARTFTAGQAAKAAGVAYHQLDYMAKTRLVVPSINEGKGSNTCRVYDFTDVVAMRVANHLRDAGVEMQELRKVVEFLQGSKEAGHSGDCFLLFAHGGEVELVFKDQLAEAISGSWKTWVVFALGDAVREVCTCAKNLVAPDRGKAKMALE